jgi:glycosyltransferase involved in cell wall biosynthesis
MINDIWSAMCVPSAFSLGLPSCLITLNSEVDFHRLYRSQGGPDGHALQDRLMRWLHRRCNGIATKRMHRYVTGVFHRCTGLIALTRGDLPEGLVGDAATAVLPPLLEESATPWRYGGTHRLLFVGNVSHFPNRLAVEWICRQFAPELHRIAPRIRITIIGASADQLRINGLSPNVAFLGQCSHEEVAQHMKNDDLFIAPIENRFGAKLKLAECASYGMPFIATRAAMTGLPFLTGIPELDLDQPADAARTVASYFNTPEALMQLSQQIIGQMRTARVEQGPALGSFLRHLMTLARKR